MNATEEKRPTANPNANCVCTGPGMCERHGVTKSRLQYNFCAGIGCTPLQCQKHFEAWEQGRKPGQTAPVAEPLPADLPQTRRRGLGDWVADGIKAATFGLVKPCGGCRKRQETLNRWFPAKHMRQQHPFAYDPASLPQFISTAQYMLDVQALASMLPADTSRIIGVARSGLCAATMVSMLLHRPLSIMRQSAGDIIDGGNGWRLTGNTGKGADGPVIVIDDTCMTGNSFKAVMPIVRREFPAARSAVVYCNPNANVKPDMWARELPWPHLLEWNLFNSVLTPSMAVDFDGILCRECPPESDDDGPRYAAFLRDAKPHYVVRKSPIPLIVTGRLEKYRPQTLDWLARHGMTCQQLIMWPGSDHHARNRADVGAWKGKHFQKFLKRRRQIQPSIFVESCPHQASRIAAVSRGLVVCPAAGRCF